MAELETGLEHRRFRTEFPPQVLADDGFFKFRNGTDDIKIGFYRKMAYSLSAATTTVVMGRCVADDACQETLVDSTVSGGAGQVVDIDIAAMSTITLQITTGSGATVCVAFYDPAY